MQVVIVGAGTFGASAAWWFARSGHQVTLVDQFEPGDPRATSGGETRLLRSAHGDASDYTTMSRRARALWLELEEESGEELFLECGVAWFAHQDDGWEAASELALTAQGIPVDRLDVADASRLYPSFSSDDLAFVLLEPEAGVLRAQRAVRTLVAMAAAHGARIVRARAEPDGSAARLEDSTRLEGDVVLWACGPWLGQLFGNVISLKVTRQELLFFTGGASWRSPGVPGWCDYDRAMYGTADLDGLGVKVALDTEGPVLHPDAELPRTSSTERPVREYLGQRFPDLEHAALLDSRTCRYELTADTHFIAAPHPEHPSVWLVGGGSGHGFKHGPAMAERLGMAITGEVALPEHFRLGTRAPSRSLRTAGSGIR